MKKLLSPCLIVVFLNVHAQEFYPNSEPASTYGKNVLGVRSMWETYNENGRQRHQFSLRMMYGVTKNFSLYIQPSISNHHAAALPRDFTLHTHLGNQIINSVPNKVFGKEYPYLFGGVYAYGKYRFFSVDGDHKHFRMAAYAAYSTARLAHDVAEPNPHGDTGGLESGLIITALRNRFSATLSGGLILPKNYTETSTDDTIVTTTINYATAINYQLSLGYLLYPKIFRDYHQPNYNVYLELHGKSYGNASVSENGEPLIIESSTLYGWNYIEADLGLQVIINSNTRIDLSIEVPLVNRSWDHFYPLYNVGLQHNFYLGKKSGGNTEQVITQ